MMKQPEWPRTWLRQAAKDLPAPWGLGPSSGKLQQGEGEALKVAENSDQGHGQDLGQSHSHQKGPHPGCKASAAKN